MKRVASELDAMSGPEKEPNREFLILQGVRFAFRVHQVRLLLYPSFKFQRMISLFLKDSSAKSDIFFQIQEHVSSQSSDLKR